MPEQNKRESFVNELRVDSVGGVVQPTIRPENYDFFEQEGHTYFGLAQAGQFIEYTLSSIGYGDKYSDYLTIKAKIFQDGPEDVQINQKEAVVELITRLLQKKDKITFYSSLYNTNITLQKGDNVKEKLDEAKEKYGDERIF